MATPKIEALPDSPLTTGLRVIEAILKDDPVLKPVVRTWRTWLGDPADTEPPQEPEMPWIRLTASRPESLNSFIDLDSITFVILAELAVAGTHQDNIVNLWQAVHDALITMKPFRGTTIRQYLWNQCKCNSLRTTNPNFSVVAPARPAPGATAGPFWCSAETRIVFLRTMAK